MKRIARFLCASLALLMASNVAKADWGTLRYGGYQPWWNPLALKQNLCMSQEERRLQRFWHDYYDALNHYYKRLEHMDWLTYYKNHGQMVNGGTSGGCGSGCCNHQQQPIQFSPVTVAPGGMQFMAPNGGMAGCVAPSAPMGGPAMGGPAMGGHAMMPGMMPQGPFMPTGYPGGYPGNGYPGGYPMPYPGPQGH